MPNVHFPNGNEFSASIGDTVRFPIQLETYTTVFCKSQKCYPVLCNGNVCNDQSAYAEGTTQRLWRIDVSLTVVSDSYYGTWGLYNDRPREAVEGHRPAIALIHINNATQVKKDAKPDILWCHQSDTLNYVKLDDPPRCPLPKQNQGFTQHGTLTVYTDNYKVQSEPAWTCQVMVNTIKLKCVHLQQTEEPQGQSIESVDVGDCRKWMKEKSCPYGSMTGFGDEGAESWKTNNPLNVKYNHWWKVCGIGGKPRYFTSHNCLMVGVEITYQAPFLELFSAATGRMPLETLATGGVKKVFKTIAWSNETSNAFWHVCRKVISLTIPVVKTIYANMNDASEHKRLDNIQVPSNDTVYQFMSTDHHAVMYIAQEKDRTTLSAIEAGPCGVEYPDTFISNSLILQYVSDLFLTSKRIPRYTGARHYPTLTRFHEDPRYGKTHEHTNLWRKSNISHTLMCSGAGMKSLTHKCHANRAVPIRNRREVNLEEEVEPSKLQNMLDYLEEKQINYSEKLMRQIMYQTCMQKRETHFLLTTQLKVDPSVTFSSFTNQNVHVIPRGDLYLLQHCARLDCATLSVVPSLKTTYPKLRDVYKNKGAFISDHMIFTRPIIQFNVSGITVTVQLQDKYYVTPHLTSVIRKPKIRSRENPLSDVMFFEICDHYYIFENATLVSKVEITEAGTEQHIIREYKKNKVAYSNENDNNTSAGTEVTMQIRSFGMFGTSYMPMLKATFFGLRKSSYFTQDDMLSHLHTMQDYIAFSARMQDAITYLEATVGKENIHATVAKMGEFLDCVVDASVAGGNAIGGFFGSVIGSTTGMAVESFTGMAARGISTFLDSLFSRVVLIIGMAGGYWSILLTLVYCGIATYKKNWNIFGKNNRTQMDKQKRKENEYLDLNNENDTQKQDAWNDWLTRAQQGLNRKGLNRLKGPNRIN